MFRVWAKARSGLARDWLVALTCKDPLFTMLPGRRATDEVWRAQVLHEADSDEHFLEANWDIAKCFENVRRTKLIECATALGYPLVVLRLSLASYEWGRALRGPGGLVTQPIFSRHGIVAGSAFAVHELVCYMWTDLRAPRVQHSISMHVYIDDICFGSRGRRAADVVHDFGAGGKAISAALAALELPLAQDKAFVIGSSWELTRRGARALGMPRAAAHSVRRLGVDHSFRRLGARLSTRATRCGLGAPP